MCRRIVYGSREATVSWCWLAHIQPGWWRLPCFIALSNDTGILVLLVYWTWRCDLQGRLVKNMDKLDGIVLEVNTTCTDIAHSCLEPIHSLTATQCPILSASVRLKCGKHSRIGLSWAVRQAGRRLCLEQTLWQSEQLFTALYGQPQAAPWLKSTTVCIFASWCASCHCHLWTWISSFMFTFRCYCGRQLSEYGRGVASHSD